MDAIQEFDSKFSKLFTQMVEIAFEFVNRNSEEVDNIYIYGSLETGYFYNVFYKINGSVVRINKVNSVSKQQYDVAMSRMFGLLNLGNDLLKQIEALFKEYNREVPTTFKMIYEPPTGKFDNQIGYDFLYKGDKEKTAGSVFDSWYEEINSLYA